MRLLGASIVTHISISRSASFDADGMARNSCPAEWMAEDVIALVNYATLYVHVYLVPRCKAEAVKRWSAADKSATNIQATESI